METSAKKYLLSLLATGHPHESMTSMLACNYCGGKFKKAEKEYNRLRREKPELFGIKKPEWKPSPELAEKRGQLAERLQRDKLYQKHIRLSFKGTPAESKREEERANSGFYKKHSDFQGVRYY